MKKSIKYLERNLTKEANVLYTENCKALLKEMLKDTNKWKDILRSVLVLSLAQFVHVCPYFSSLPT